MIRIRAAWDGAVLTLDAQGHAGHNPGGPDIVCAGVSALCCAMALALKRLGPIKCLQGSGSMRMECAVKGDVAWGVVLGALEGLKHIAQQYPAAVDLGVDFALGQMLQSNQREGATSD